MGAQFKWFLSLPRKGNLNETNFQMQQTTFCIGHVAFHFKKLILVSTHLWLNECFRMYYTNTFVKHQK